MIAHIGCGDMTITHIGSLMDGTVDASVSCDEYDSGSVSYFIMLREYDCTVYVVDDHTRSMRMGWNIPRKIQLYAKPFRNDIRRVYRSALPRRIRQIDSE